MRSSITRTPSCFLDRRPVVRAGQPTFGVEPCAVHPDQTRLAEPEPDRGLDHQPHLSMRLSNSTDAATPSASLPLDTELTPRAEDVSS